MKKSLILTIALLCSLPALARAGSFELSTDKLFAPGEPVSVTVSAMDVPTLDVRLYRVDDPKSYFLGLEDVHSPEVQTKRDVSSPSEMVGAIKRKAGRLLRDDYRGKLTDNIRNDVVAALGLPHAEEAASPPPESYELFPILKRFDLVNRWQENLVVSRSGEWQYHTIDVTIPKAGCYLVEAVYQDEVAYTMVVVTPMSFIVKNSSSDSLIYVADRVTGKPMRGVKVSVYDQAKNLLFKGRTDSEGTYYSKVKAGDSDTIYVFAEDGDSFTLADPYAYWWEDANDKVYTYTERPVYRPGDTVFFRSILRESTDSGLKVPDRGDDYLVIVNDAKGNEVFRGEFPLTEYGSLAGSLTLGVEPALGEYEIVVGLNGQNYYSRFKVEEYKKPEYEVKVKTDKDVYIRGETIKADVDAGYYFGSPVTDAKVDYIVYRSVYELPWWWGYDWGWYFMDSDYYYAHEKVMVDSGTATLDDQGRLKLTVNTSDFLESPDNDYMFTIEASVTDLSRRVVTTSSVVKVVRSSYSVNVRPDRWIYAPGDTARITATVSDFNNNGIAGVPVTLIVTLSGWEANARPTSMTLTGTTNAAGDAVIEYPVRGVGDLTFVASVFDKAGNSTSARDSSYSITEGYAWGGESGGGVSIVPDKQTYAVGDTAHILIAAPVTDTYLLVTTEGESIYDSRVVKIAGGSTMLDLPIKERYAPNIYISVSAIFADELYTENKNIIVPPTEKFVNVKLTSNKAVYEPQEKGTFTVTTTDDKGKPVTAEVSLGIVDDAIYAICPELVDEIQKYFYSLRYHSVDTSSSLYFRFYGYSHRKGLLAGLPKRETKLADFKGDSLVEPTIRKDFKDTMYWSPTITTDRNGTATISVSFPDNLTRWRATVRGVTAGDMMGQVTYTVISRKDLLVRIEAPRFFRQGDDLVISTIAHNYLSTDKKVHFTFEVKGLTLVSGKPVDAVVPKNGEKRIDWHVHADLVGNATLVAKAMTNEVSDGMELAVPVLPMGIRETKNEVGEIIKESGTLTVKVDKPATTIKDAAELTLTTSPTLANTMLAAIPFLVGYPYG
jgi:alpha-2-macroglobulin